MKDLIKKAKNDEIKRWVEVNLQNYLKKHNLEYSEQEHVVDYLNSENAPKRLMKMSVVQALSNTEKWNNALMKKGKMFDEVLNEDIKIIDEFKGFTFVEILSKRSFEREGKLMQNCVSSYFDRDCTIISMRDKKNMPHATLELNNKTLDQVKGKQNKSVTEKYQDVIIDFMEKHKYNIRSQELSNIGYVDLNDFEKEFISKNFPEYNIRKFGDVSAIKC